MRVAIGQTRLESNQRVGVKVAWYERLCGKIIKKKRSFRGHETMKGLFSGLDWGGLKANVTLIWMLTLTWTSPRQPVTFVRQLGNSIMWDSKRTLKGNIPNEVIKDIKHSQNVERFLRVALVALLGEGDRITEIPQCRKCNLYFKVGRLGKKKNPDIYGIDIVETVIDSLG